MALFATQLQPWEENQSPSPTEERENPYELALARSRSSSKNGHQSDTKPPSPINTLHRQLSGDPDAPPPAWKRRPSVNNSTNGRSLSNGPPSASRRHPGLQMTLSGAHQPLPDAGPLNESPNGSHTDLAELGLPQPAFRKQHSRASSGRSSNRSSTHSLSGLTSEELWQLDQPDLSNPMRPSAETPLATARRNSRIGRSPSVQGYISPEVIWPSATPEEQSPVLKSKSTTSVASAGKKRITIRKRGSRNQVAETSPNDGVYLHGTTVSPTSLSRPDSMILSSAQSSTTSLNSQGFSPVKVTPVAAMNRPPSTYYSRDFLSSLAPREGGYAIAATMGNGLGAHGTMSVDERRRSQYDPTMRRAPVSKSAGMGRWSLDGGEHYGVRPYGTPSAATTASNLSRPSITSPETSPPLEEPRLPEGASPASPVNNAAQTGTQQLERDSSSPSAGPVMTIPVNPSPLSQQTHANDVSTPKSEKGPPITSGVAAARSAPVLTSTSSATTSAPLNTKKSKKDLAKDAKADAQRQKIEAQKAEYKRKAEAKAAAARAKADKKEAEAKAKQEAKRKEKEEKEKRKAEKLAKKAGKSSSFSSLPLGGAKEKKESVPPVPPIPAAHAAPTPSSTTTPGPVPFPRTSSSANAPKVAAQPRQTAVSMPLDKSIPAPAPRTFQSAAPTPKPAPALKEQKSRMSLFGTLKKRFSSGPSSSQPDVRQRQASDAANIGSMPTELPAAVSAPASQLTAAAAPSVPPKSSVSAPSPPPGGSEATPIQSSPPTVVVPLSPSTSQQPTPTRVTSRDQGSIKSGRSNSVRGPRPMPVTNTSPDRHAHSQSRPTSLITTPSTEAAPITPAAGFPFRNSQINPEIVTPSTFTETESSMFSHTAPGQSETSSPFTSVGSRKSSLTGDEKPAAPLTNAVDGPERGDSAYSKSSEETLQARIAPAPLVI